MRINNLIEVDKCPICSKYSSYVNIISPARLSEALWPACQPGRRSDQATDIRFQILPRGGAALLMSCNWAGIGKIAFNLSNLGELVSIGRCSELKNHLNQLHCLSCLDIKHKTDLFYFPFLGGIFTNETERNSFVLKQILMDVEECIISINAQFNKL